jgi:hypothetical protein
LAFVVFTVSFAVVRNLFGRMWGRIPEKDRSNWKKDFKRRLGRGDNNNNSSNNDGNFGNERIQQPDNGHSGNPYDYQTLGDLP